MVEAVDEFQQRRYPPDGDVERWVLEGPPGHVNYGGGPVVWVPDGDAVGG